MDRLTFEGNFCDIAMCDAEPEICGGTCSQREVWERLKGYEDTGLTPEEIEETLGRFSAFLDYMTNGRMSKTNYTIEAMRSEAEACIMEECDKCEDRQFSEKYEKAEAEGRLIVLPCKIGDKEAMQMK